MRATTFSKSNFVQTTMSQTSWRTRAPRQPLTNNVSFNRSTNGRKLAYPTHSYNTTPSPSPQSSFPFVLRSSNSPTLSAFQLGNKTSSQESPLPPETDSKTTTLRNSPPQNVELMLICIQFQTLQAERRSRFNTIPALTLFKKRWLGDMALLLDQHLQYRFPITNLRKTLSN